MAHTGGVLLDETGLTQQWDGPWHSVETPRRANQLLVQLTMTGTGTVIVQGRLGPNHAAVQLTSQTADWTDLVDYYPQIRAVLRSPTGSVDVLVSVPAFTYTNELGQVFDPAVTLTASADDETPVASQVVTILGTRSDGAAASGKSITATLTARARTGGTLVGVDP